MRLDPELHETESIPRPAPVALSDANMIKRNTLGFVDPTWRFPASKTTGTDDERTDIKSPPSEPDEPHSPGEIVPLTPRRMSFFDVGGLLENGSGTGTPQATTSTNGHIPYPPPSRNLSTSHSARRGSTALLQDMGGLLSPHDERGNGSPVARNFSRPTSSQVPQPERASVSTAATRARTPSTGISPPPFRRETTTRSLQDVGGLLNSA